MDSKTKEYEDLKKLCFKLKHEKDGKDKDGKKVRSLPLLSLSLFTFRSPTHFILLHRSTLATMAPNPRSSNPSARYSFSPSSASFPSRVTNSASPFSSPLNQDLFRKMDHKKDGKVTLFPLSSGSPSPFLMMLIFLSPALSEGRLEAQGRLEARGRQEAREGAHLSLLRSPSLSPC